MTTSDQDADTPRYVVSGGGTPTHEQLAALTVALTPVAVPAEDDVSPGTTVPAWARAALMEGVGHRTFVALPDLAAGRFPLGGPAG